LPDAGPGVIVVVVVVVLVVVFVVTAAALELGVPRSFMPPTTDTADRATKPPITHKRPIRALEK
jgi:hypothetical protein